MGGCQGPGRGFRVWRSQVIGFDTPWHRVWCLVQGELAQGPENHTRLFIKKVVRGPCGSKVWGLQGPSLARMRDWVCRTPEARQGARQASLRWYSPLECRSVHAASCGYAKGKKWNAWRQAVLDRTHKFFISLELGLITQIPKYGIISSYEIICKLMSVSLQQYILKYIYSIYAVLKLFVYPVHPGSRRNKCVYFQYFRPRILNLQQSCSSMLCDKSMSKSQSSYCPASNQPSQFVQTMGRASIWSASTQVICTALKVARLKHTMSSARLQYMCYYPISSSTDPSVPSSRRAEVQDFKIEGNLEAD